VLPNGNRRTRKGGVSHERYEQNRENAIITITPWERKEPKKRENDKEGKKETWEGYLLRRICI